MFHTPSDAHPPCWYPADSLHFARNTNSSGNDNSKTHNFAAQNARGPIALNAHGTDPAKHLALANCVHLRLSPRSNPHSAAAPFSLPPPRFPALALFGGRPPQRVMTVIPAAENLRRTGLVSGHKELVCYLRELVGPCPDERVIGAVDNDQSTTGDAITFAVKPESREGRAAWSAWP
jgi:hypothetical protein